ncbi:MAG: hypothetical protein M3014_10680 [Chloroflexota bacterium]|nr:hypothetical protein [Chloroflexota bacterium]
MPNLAPVEVDAGVAVDAPSQPVNTSIVNTSTKREAISGMHLFPMRVRSLAADVASRRLPRIEVIKVIFPIWCRPGL